MVVVAVELMRSGSVMDKIWRWSEWDLLTDKLRVKEELRVILGLWPDHLERKDGDRINWDGSTVRKQALREEEEVNFGVSLRGLLDTYLHSVNDNINLKNKNQSYNLYYVLHTISII